MQLRFGPIHLSRRCLLRWPARQEMTQAWRQRPDERFRIAAKALELGQQIGCLWRLTRAEFQVGKGTFFVACHQQHFRPTQLRRRVVWLAFS